MSKWNYGLACSSSHVNVSLWDAAGKSPLFYDTKAEFTMSPLMRAFVAGQLKYAADITYFLAPYINSYKRFQVGTFAPTKAVWSRDNRTAGFRLCGEGGKAIRIECRIGGADLNPYLAFAALIAAGLQGIEEKLELEPPFAGDAYAGRTLPEVPKTLPEAAGCLADSGMLRRALGDAVVEHYAQRPTECRDFYCGYLLDPALDERWKPSHCKLVVTHEEQQREMLIHNDPARPDAWCREPFRSQILAWAAAAAAEGGKVIVWQGDAKIAVMPETQET